MGIKKKRDVRILIVDDDEKVREIMCYVFEKRGFVVEYARDGSEALQKVAQRTPNIIILDFTMPDMDGLQVCERLRENPGTQDIPIIFLSAQTHIAEVIRYIPGAVIEYIEKPCDVAYLLSRVNKLTAVEKTP